MRNHRSKSRCCLCGRTCVLVLFCIVQTATAPGAAAQMDRSRNRIMWARPLAEAAGSDQSAGWRFEVTPFLWAAGLDGTIGVLGRTAQVDVGFGEIVEDLDFALMFTTELRKGRWGEDKVPVTVAMISPSAVGLSCNAMSTVTSVASVTDTSLRSLP